ncbi:MAG TPA: PIN domain-containing protein [Armatimonadota bacterium]|nr:PIN domain-containing protein [Armatimonadota bacterium]
MSARPFWVLFTICVIILIEWLVVPRIMNTVISKDIVSMMISLHDVDTALQSKGIKAPPKFKEHLRKSPDDILAKKDLREFGFRAKWCIVNSREPEKAFIKVLSLVGLLIIGILAGFLFASVAFRHLVRFGDRLSGMSSTDKVAALMGLMIGLLISVLVVPNIKPYISGPGPLLAMMIVGIITYMSIWALMSMKDELKAYFPGAAKAGEPDRAFQKPKILDTNVIIDGRIADICRSGFVEGQVCIPSFILEELQHIADSPDTLRRARGRRGLDILNQMRKELNLAVRQTEPVNPENAEEVDTRLVKLAQEIDGSIVTNDFNLNKVAEIHGVAVLNINELANALKPVVLPGEEMSVSVIKEGKELNQGIAYLDDGTMVVVEGAKKHIGGTVDVTVTSVLQTVAGKMIFSNLKAIQEEEDDLIGRNVRSYSSFRPRKKAR